MRPGGSLSGVSSALLQRLLSAAASHEVRTYEVPNHLQVSRRAPMHATGRLPGLGQVSGRCTANCPSYME